MQSSEKEAISICFDNFIVIINHMINLFYKLTKKDLSNSTLISLHQWRYAEAENKPVQKYFIDYANKIITKLIDDGYLNESRFSKEFTRGKFNHKNWGRIRIRIELKKRKISKKNIEIGLDELDENNYIKKFNELFERQLDKQNHKIDMYSKKKIFDYFKYRGWENDMVFNKINALK